MTRFRTFGAALMIAGFLTIGVSSTATLQAFDGASVSNGTICQLLGFGVAKAALLPDSNIKQALLSYLQAEQVKYNCSAN